MDQGQPIADRDENSEILKMARKEIRPISPYQRLIGLTALFFIALLLIEMKSANSATSNSMSQTVLYATANWALLLWLVGYFLYYGGNFLGYSIRMYAMIMPISFIALSYLVVLLYYQTPPEMYPTATIEGERILSAQVTLFGAALFSFLGPSIDLARSVSYSLLNPA